MSISKAKYVYIKHYLEDLYINGIHRYHKRDQGICNGRLIVENSTSCSRSGFLVSISWSVIVKSSKKDEIPTSLLGSGAIPKAVLLPSSHRT